MIGDRSREHTLPGRHVVLAHHEPSAPTHAERARRARAARSGAHARACRLTRRGRSTRQEESASVMFLQCGGRRRERCGGSGRRVSGAWETRTARQIGSFKQARARGLSERLTGKRGSRGAWPGTLGEGVARGLRVRGRSRGCWQRARTAPDSRRLRTDERTHLEPCRAPISSAAARSSGHSSAWSWIGSPRYHRRRRRPRVPRLLRRGWHPRRAPLRHLRSLRRHAPPTCDDG